MSKSKFQWDVEALIPEVVEIDFAPLTSGAKPDVVKFHEFSRTELTEFVAASLELKVVETDESGKIKEDADGGQIRKKFAVVEAEHATFLFKSLAVATRGTKTAEQFAEMPLTATAIAALVDMLLKLNHVDEVLATSGNWLMLPTVMSILAAADEKSRESESQRTTSEA